MRPPAPWAIPPLASLLLSPCAFSQSAPNAACSLDLPSFTSPAPNIFNPQQEQYLGDALAQYTESDLHLAPQGSEADDRLTQIGDRLLAALPPSGLQYHFRIYESGEVNGFSLAGGHVYISRKLIAAVKNEDELAGVLAHEIGHISTHQSAIELTRALRIRLGVTQVTDRDDVFAKIHRFFSTPSKPQEDQDKEKADQFLADRVGFYAMVRAGYAPESFASFLNDLTLNKGKTGNWLSDAFGLTHEDSQRYRNALKLIATLPANCKSITPSASQTFLAWQRTVVEERPRFHAEGNTGDHPLQLDNPLRPSLWRIRFSPDGRYLLAQDEGSISVLDKAAAKLLFRIDAPDVEAAQFTPDSQSIVFHDSKLRVERWSIVQAKRTGVKELVVFEGCNQTLLAPDGNTLVCATLRIKDGIPGIDVRLIDVDSGKTYFEKPSLYQASQFTSLYATYLLDFDGLTGASFANMILSPDGRYLVVTVLDRNLAYDLQKRQPLSLGGKLRDLAQARMSFLGPDQLFLVGDLGKDGLHKATILSFPDGRLLSETLIGNQQIEAVSKGPLLIAGPLKDYAAGIFNPEKHQFVVESKFPSIDSWENSAAFEGKAGDVFVVEIGKQGAQQIPLPMGPLPNPRAAAFSPDGKYLAVSMKNRAELWDLGTGKQLSLIRPFRSIWIGQDNHIFVQFPKYLDKEQSQMELTVAPPSGTDLTKLGGDDWKDAWQYRNVQIHFKPMGRDKAVNHHATLQVKKMNAETIAWSRDYPHETPACWSAEDDPADNRLVLAWDLSNDSAKAEIKLSPTLQREAAALKDQKKGLLLETVNAETGAPLDQVVLPESDLTQGYNDARRASVSGQYVLVRGEHGNTAVYQLKDGAKVGEFFGKAIATDAKTSLIAATNREDEILLVDERTGKELERFSLGSPIRAAHIVNDKSKSLLVLTADQTVHRLPLPNASAAQAAQANAPTP